ncbi:MAG TPA: hypothetical protein QGG70_01835 [Candidatus Pacearchaeota archaeon]|jgi:hypothetical protein|nr:hypothetical protein [Candidatus Pacearchaeota archaeon]
MPKEKNNEETEEETEEESSQTQIIEEEPSNFRKLALEEIMPTMGESETGGLENTQWIRIAQQEEEKKEETPIYDLEKATSERGYDTDSTYKIEGTGGDYDMVQSSAPTMQDSSNQDQGINPMNQAKSYETSGEKELKERRKRDRW